MIYGIYGTRFTVNGQDIGGGIVVIDGTSVHGGDSDYLYKGHYCLQDNNRVEATVTVQNYTGQLNALVGPLSSFQLTLAGVAESKIMRLSGYVDRQDHGTIQITLTKISDLADPSMGCFDAACAVVVATGFEAPCMVTRQPPPITGMMDGTETKRPRHKTRNG
ncbi:MAG: negative regulator,GrlR [Nitrospira sp.]|jgi:hypothetical protein|nr:negative regulator,GrlR [Nitrospira sp.]